MAITRTKYSQNFDSSSSLYSFVDILQPRLFASCPTTEGILMMCKHCQFGVKILIYRHKKYLLHYNMQDASNAMLKPKKRYTIP
jgi:hypothetical protein